MHHLIGADVLLKTISGYSDIAAIYSAGVKLYYCCGLGLGLTLTLTLSLSLTLTRRQAVLLLR